MIRKETIYGLIGVVVILGILAGLRTFMIDFHNHEANALVERYAPCPTCYEPCYGMNDEVVCRNEECPAYGLPQKIN